MAEAWTYDRADNTDQGRILDENGLLVARLTVVDEDGHLMASAPQLQKQVKLLRKVAEDARKELEAQATYFGVRLDPENNLFRILRKLEAALEATKET